MHIATTRIRGAYLSREFALHPDESVLDVNAAACFGELTVAYELLFDAARKAPVHQDRQCVAMAAQRRQMRDKLDVKERAALVRLQDELRTLLEEAAREAEPTRPVVASAWVRVLG